MLSYGICMFWWVYWNYEKNGNDIGCWNWFREGIFRFFEKNR